MLLLEKLDTFEKAQCFHAERGRRIKQKRVWRDLSEGPYAVLHWIPISEKAWFEHEPLSDENFHEFIQMGGHGMGKPNEEGIRYQFSGADEILTGEEGLRQRLFWNAQIFCSGAAEMAIALSFHCLPEIQGRWIQEYSLVKNLRTAMDGFREGMSSKGVTGGIFVGVSILFAKHCGLLTEIFPPATSPYSDDEDVKVEKVIEDFQSVRDFVKIEREIFNPLCQQFGLSKCSYYERGNRIFII